MVRPAAGASPGDALVAAVGGADLGADTRVWVAGEAAAVQRIRRHLFEDRGLPRAHASVRGYWKHGRSGDATPTTPERATADSGGLNEASNDPPTNSSRSGAAAPRNAAAHRAAEHHARCGGDHRLDRRLAKPANDTRQAGTISDDLAGDGHNEAVR